MSNLVGTVSNLKTFDNTTNAGKPYKMYQFEVNGTKVKTPDFNIKTGKGFVSEGDTVSIDQTPNSRGYPANTVFDAPHGSTPSAPAAAPTPAPRQQAAPDNRQMSIELQSARACAVQFVNGLASIDGVIAKTKKTPEALADLVKRYTAEFYAQQQELLKNPTLEVETPKSLEEDAS